MNAHASSSSGFAWPPAVTVYSHEQAREAARAALAQGSGMTLLSPDSAADATGIGWMATLGRLIREEFPTLTLYTILDCGAAGGRAMAALRADIDAIIFTGGGRSLMSLADQADDLGKGLLPERPESLDFASLPDASDRAAATLADWFATSS